MRTLFALFLFNACSLVAADSAPDWVTELSTRTVPAYDSEVRSVTLLDECRVSLDPDGTVHRTMRYALRVLNAEGWKDASVALPYDKRFSKIKDLHAWMIGPNGSVKGYGKEAIADVNVKENFELYADTRLRVLDVRSALVGSTFAWTGTTEETNFLLQDRWSFQSERPVLVSRYALTLPPGWDAQGSVFNTPALAPVVEGTTRTWEMKSLPYLKPESSSPSFESVAPWMGINFYPVQQTASDKVVRNWTELATWQSRLAERQADTNDEMVRKVHELTTSALTPFAKVQAIARYIQQTKYVAIMTNIARGGGYQPHLATQVFEKQYGDCKDKANLMRALLKIAGVDSYLVAIFSGDRNYVHPEWAAPTQFNHMIIAIRVPDDVTAPAVLVHPVLGRLLIFDSTDPVMPLGEVPEDEQGSYALILAPAKGDLIKVPVAPAESNRMNVAVTATLGETGALDAKVAIESHGDSAAEMRGWHTYADAKRLQEHMERWVEVTAKQNTLEPISFNDQFDQDKFGMQLNFKAPVYAQVMQQRMIVFRPAVLSRLQTFQVQGNARRLPVVLNAQCYHKQVKVKLPAGFQVDEMPDAAHFDSSFGKYVSTYKVADGELTYTEDLDITAAVIPSANYPDVKSFFQHVAGSEQAPLLLVKN